MSSVDKTSNFLIVERSFLSTIFQPLKSNRIKYTCFEVSQNFIILGATSGGLYVFKREPCIFLQLVPNKEGSVNNISLSWDEKLIAFSTLKGVTCVLELLEGSEARLINRSLEHYGSLVTSLVWAKALNHLYAGDNLGRLSVINVSLFMNKNIFHIPAYMFMKLDSAVVQISCHEEYLLVSTRTRTYICDTTKEKYKQIGTQLRDGLYGATFLKSSDALKIYCARPGSRLWEADITGSVKSTHQFKKALAVQSVAVVKLEDDLLVQNCKSSWPDQSFNFCNLIGLFNKYLFTFKNDGVYVFDPTTAEVVLWSDHYKDIVDAKCVNDVIYLWTSRGHIHSFVITPLNKCLVQLYVLGKYQLCVDVLDKFLEHAKSFSVMSKVTCLVGLKDHFPDITTNVKLFSYLENLKLTVKEKQMPSNLDSGIFLVDNKHWKKWKLNIKNNKSSKKTKIIRSKSLSDLSTLSTKTCNIDRNTASFSLPQIEFSFKEPTLQNTVNQNCNESSLAWNVTSSFIQEIPFLSLTSPDLIQSTILELGQNVKRKLSISTKSLQDKWHVLEEKIKFNKEFNGSETSDFTEIAFSNSKSTENISVVEDSTEKNIVFLPLNSDHKRKLSIHVADIINICEQISLGDKNDDVIFALFDKVSEELNKINQTSSDDNIKKTFPFKQCLSAKYLDILKQIFSDSLHNHLIKRYLNRFKKYKFNTLDYQDHPIILKTIHNEDDLLSDVALSHMLLLFSEILDSNTVLENLEALQMPCSFFSWSIILDIFQDDAFSFFATKRESHPNYFECSLPYLLNMVFLMLRLEQIESSCHMAVKANLKLYHISYLIIKLCLHLEFTGIKYQNCIDKCYKLLLNFITCLLNGSTLLLKELHDSETRCHIELAFYYVNKLPGYKCQCNYPIICSSKVPTKYPRIGYLLLTYYMMPFKYVKCPNINNELMVTKFKLNALFLDSKSTHDKFCNNFNGFGSTEHDFSFDLLYPNVHDRNEGNSNIKYIYGKIIMLLQAMPELLGVILYYYSSRFSFNCLPFIVQFGRIEDVCISDSKNNPEFWKKIFQLQTRLTRGECCLCHNKNNVQFNLDWTKVLLTALKYLGSSNTLKLMIACSDSIPSDAVNVSFLRLCFLRPLIDQNDEQNLALIDSVYGKLEPFNESTSEDSSFSEFSETEDEDESDSSQSIELDVDYNVCCHCSLLLRFEDESHRERGIRVFRCKHVYHTACLRKANSLFDCPLCLRRNHQK